MSSVVDVRRLNNEGIAIFAKVDWGSTDSAGDPPSQILFDDDFTEIVTFSNDKTRKVDSKASFETYLELFDIIEECLGTEMALEEVEQDRGLWAWFSLLLYENLRNGSMGSWKGADMPRYIPSGDSLSYYRHQVFSPYAITKMHGKKAAMVFLCGKTIVWPEINEQILCVAPIISNKALISAATALYYDSDKRKAKPGAASQGRGSSRRFRTIFWQLYETYDLRDMDESQIIEIFPSEFDHFKPEVTT